MLFGSTQERIQKFLSNTKPLVFNLYALTAAFVTYFCMYGFRKPFSVGRFEGSVHVFGLGDVDYKIVLLIAQVLGYTLSKFLGIKIVSESSKDRRARTIVLMIAAAEVSLLVFALVPKPWNIFFLFLNGLPLGMIWGLVFSYLEGRRSTELLGAGLSASYIVASGAVKSAGSWVLTLGVSEFWMPVLTGALFIPALLLAVYLLAALPPPTAEDERLRTKRLPMVGSQRRIFFARFAPGLIALTGLYMLLTAYRDFRDNFAREIWDALGQGLNPEIFTKTEIPIAVTVLVALALMVRVRDNRLALTLIHVLMGVGTMLIGGATYAFQADFIGSVMWMTLIGLGLYLAYVPYGCLLFDRLIACVGTVATAGFMIYVTDAFGYLGSVALMLYKNFGQGQLSWLEFFIGFSYVTSIVCTVAFAYSLYYFYKHPDTVRAHSKI